MGIEWWHMKTYESGRFPLISPLNPRQYCVSGTEAKHVLAAKFLAKGKVADSARKLAVKVVGKFEKGQISTEALAKRLF